MKIDIQIDKIVLGGIELSSKELEQLSASIKCELARGARNSDAVSAIQDSSKRSVKPEAVSVEQRVDVQNLGIQIANSVFERLAQ